MARRSAPTERPNAATPPLDTSGTGHEHSQVADDEHRCVGHGLPNGRHTLRHGTGSIRHGVHNRGTHVDAKRRQCVGVSRRLRHDELLGPTDEHHAGPFLVGQQSLKQSNLHAESFEETPPARELTRRLPRPGLPPRSWHRPRPVPARTRVRALASFMLTVALGGLALLAAAAPGPAPGIAAPGTAAPGIAAPGTAAPGTAAPSGTAAPGTAAPGIAANGAAPLTAERTAALDALVIDWHGQGPLNLPGGVSVARASGKLARYRRTAHDVNFE